MFLAFLKLIRWKNLLIIAFTQIAVHYFLVRGMVSTHMGLGMSLQLRKFDFSLLVFSTLLIAAAGYIINDYFDTKIDHINKPEKNMVGRQISRRRAMFWHTVFNITGVLAGFLLAVRVRQPNLGFIQLFSSGVLWFYSTDFKKRILIGNILIAFLTFMVPMVVVLYDAPLIKLRYQEILAAAGTDLKFLLYFVSGLSLFAFITTLIRELVKDMEDVEGDSAYGAVTLPVYKGTLFAKKLVYLLSLGCMALLGYVMYLQWNSDDWVSFYYFLITLQIPFLFFIFRLKKASVPHDYHLASRIIKVVMLAGVGYCILFYYLLVK